MDQVPLEERLLAGWSRRLKELTPLVGGLVRDKEDTFLDLGQKVYEVNAQAREFCSEAGKLTDLSSGRLIESVLDEIRSSFVQMQRICKESGFEDGMDYLRRTLESVHALERLMAEFRQVVRNLRMMGVSTRIESARMDEGSRGFETIAEELEQLAQNVVTHTYRIQGETKALSGRVARAQEGLGQILSLQKQCADGFFSSISRDIGRLEAMEVKAAATASELAGRMEEIGSSVGEMVSSIQFHDITRQRVEHVEEALQEVLCIIDRQSEEGRQVSDAELVWGRGGAAVLPAAQRSGTLLRGGRVPGDAPARCGGAHRRPGRQAARADRGPRRHGREHLRKHGEAPDQGRPLLQTFGQGRTQDRGNHGQPGEHGFRAGPVHRGHRGDRERGGADRAERQCQIRPHR
ncbi:MAG: hypothetical protein ACOC15_01165 [Desulfovibrionales bacterium]